MGTWLEHGHGKENMETYSIYRIVYKKRSLSIAVFPRLLLIYKVRIFIIRTPLVINNCDYWLEERGVQQINLLEKTPVHYKEQMSHIPSQLSPLINIQTLQPLFRW